MNKKYHCTQENQSHRQKTMNNNTIARKKRCELCHKLKIKCDLKQPNCNQCLKRGKICIYLQKRKYNTELQQYIANIRIQHKIPISTETSIEQIFLSSKSNQIWLLRLIRGTIFNQDPNFLWIRNGRLTESSNFLQACAKYS